MRRRAFLRGAALAAVGLAGCVGDGPSPGGDGTPTGTPTDTATDTLTPTSDDSPTDEGTPPQTEETPPPTDGPTPTPASSLESRSFEVTDEASCGTETDRAHVERSDSRVVVTGTIDASNPCHTAELESATYDAGTERLTVSVRTYPPDPEEYCAQCTADIDYRAEFEFDGDVPGEVVVRHDGERVEESASQAG